MTDKPRTTIVTGGTGALGSRVVRAFLGAGDRVVVPWIVDRERDAVAKAQPDALGSGQLTLLQADVAQESGAASVVAAAGEPAVLINGVGGFAGGAPLHKTDLETWERLWTMNVRSVVAMSRAALPAMLAHKRGVILNVASRAAIDRPAGLAAYSASKAAVIVLTETLQREVANDGIRVNAIVPTTIDTPANRAAMPKADFSQWTPPDRIALILLWLASDAATTVRGGLIPV
ncbi:MAG TPA: SDR family NAD(P)-dependent oxidoreductase [Myxococcota bacterium]|nr:SDR family NAD(P)-dependent oxidoreductase [Myxococcota bacterium]